MKDCLILLNQGSNIEFFVAVLIQKLCLIWFDTSINGLVDFLKYLYIEQWILFKLQLFEYHRRHISAFIPTYWPHEVGFFKKHSLKNNFTEYMKLTFQVLGFGAASVTEGDLTATTIATEEGESEPVSSLSCRSSSSLQQSEDEESFRASEAEMRERDNLLKKTEARYSTSPH